MHLLEVMSPTGSTSLKSSTVFHSSDPKALFHIDDDRDESVSAEIDDEQIRVAPASQLFVQESDAEDDLRQIYHSHENKDCPNVPTRFQNERETRQELGSEAQV